MLPVWYIVGFFLTFHSQNTPKDETWAEDGGWEDVVYLCFPIYCISVLFSKAK